MTPLRKAAALKMAGLGLGWAMVPEFDLQGAVTAMMADPTLPFPEIRGDPSGHEESASRVRISSPAGRLLRAASWLLPPSDRARYAREYDSELWELASAGAGRVGQLLYALRQALRAVQIRRVLLSPRSRSAGP